MNDSEIESDAAIVTAFPYRSDIPAMVAFCVSRDFGVHVFPTHGMRDADTETGCECDCMEWRRARAERNGVPVEQCPSPGKLPRLRDWPNRATTNPNVILAWYRRNPLTNFSAVTGTRSGIIVYDFDGEEGIASWHDLQRKHGKFPATVRSKSGSGKGGHVWALQPSGLVIRNSAGVIAPGIDIRGENGQIVLPGSRHKSNKRYHFEEGCAPDEVELAEAPQAYIELALEACKKTRQPSSEPFDDHRPRVRRGPGVRSSSQRSNSLAIGDGRGRGGFHGPINGNAVKFFANFGADADATYLKHVLRRTILSAPADNHHSSDIERYASDAYLDSAIDSARNYIKKGAA